MFALFVSVLLSIGMQSEVFVILLYAGVFGLITLILFFLETSISKRGKKVVQALSDELNKEDDVLLQATAFSQSLLLFLVNLTLTNVNEKLFLSVWIGLSLASFYITRAYAKIKGSPKYRYYSAYLLGLIMTNTVGVALFISTDQTIYQFFSRPIVPDLILLFYTPFWAWVVFREFVRKILKKRYGYS
jgi:hypothetical protein